MFSLSQRDFLRKTQLVFRLIMTLPLHSSSVTRLGSWRWLRADEHKFLNTSEEKRREEKRREEKRREEKRREEKRAQTEQQGGESAFLQR